MFWKQVCECFKKSLTRPVFLATMKTFLQQEGKKQLLFPLLCSFLYPLNLIQDKAVRIILSTPVGTVLLYLWHVCS